MKPTAIILFTLMTFCVFAQKKNQLIVINEEPVGMYSIRGGVVFTDTVKDTTMKTIAFHFSSQGEYNVRLNWNLSEYKFQDSYYLFNDQGEFLGNSLVSGEGNNNVLFEGNKNDINLHNKLIINAANRYVIADGIALAGAVGGIALADDPVAASQVIAITSVVSYIIRMSGHFQLVKAGDTPI